jgi:imidazolonepropionase-like amidohydrolase
MIRTSLRLTVASLATAAVVAAFAVQSSVAQAPAGGAVALTGARVIDGTGRPPIESATILINANGRIQAVGAANAVQVPAGATRVDMTGKTIMPGMINAHAHLQYFKEMGGPVREQLIRRLRLYADYGVTSAVSLGSNEEDELEGLKLRDDQARGPLDRARIYTGGLNAVGKTPEEARKSVDRLADLKVDVIKFHINGTPNDMNTETWSAIIDESKKKGLRTFVHIFYLKDAQAAVDKGLDVIAHSVRDQDVSPQLIAAMKAKNVAYIPTLTRDLSVFVYETRPAFFDDPFFQRGMSIYRDHVDILNDPKRQEQIRNNKNAQAIKPALDQAMKNLKTLSDAGVTIAMGTDSGVTGAGNVGRWQGYFEHVELEYMVKSGMTPMQTIVAATGGAARATKLDKDLGTIQAGKQADLLVLNANPLTDIKNTRQIHSVWISGRRLAAPETR